MLPSSRLKRFAKYAWASPASAVGLLLAVPLWACGAHASRVAGVLEVGGGPLAAWLRRLPAACRFSAITFGHVILGVDRAALADCREHEHVHVRQYEKLGLLFFPLYLGSSLWQALRGGDPYLDNCFEREAFAHSDPRDRPRTG
ncbi:signal peptide prediction [Aquabacterium sp. A7-Y]|uniref:signal peptide prediction n=1 Tax=Aquabacterium sp. A7-Y TaxID=1349605 RepID=UPI00223E36E5|nr:signal peptide prediction [Aquabacterium sp. A7-Y]MCW7536637.1 signal peptide prediction [Aquabacterium sp. A7-Y]